MSDSRILTDYEAVRPSGWRDPQEGEWSAPGADEEPPPGEPVRKVADARPSGTALSETWVPRPAHFVSYIGLFLFTSFVFFRPYELFSIPEIQEAAQWLAVFTLAVFLPSQFAAEGNITARPREVNLALLLLLAALLSVPLAINPGEAWDNFVEFFKVILMFVVMVNVVRTERRLRGMLMLAMAVSVMVSFYAFNDYQSGRFDLGGHRLKGVLGGLFGNPNDLALHLVTMVPLAAGLALARRGVL
jgi:hypothetical protein